MGKTVLIILAVVGALALTCIGAMVVGGIWFAGQVGPPEGITTTITMPDSVYVGDSFDIVVTVTNQLDHARTIMDLDIYEPLLDGTSVASVEPEYTNLDTGLGSATYTMDLTLEAGSSVDITLKAVAVTPGVYTGDIDVSVDSVLNFTTESRVLAIYDKP